MEDWKEIALLMQAQGSSGRHIAKTVGKSKSTVNDFLSKTKTSNLNKNKNSPRILFIDIELKPILAQVWRLWDQNVGLNQIESDWSILSYCAKWIGEDEIFYDDLRDSDDLDDDTPLLDQIWKLLNEADFVVGQNSKRFDTKKINARLVMGGYPKPSTFRQIDTLEIVKREFGFTSNKLEYLTDKLCTKSKKKKHTKFPGHTLWAECLKGNMEAWHSMEEYNIADVTSLEELYNIISSWDSKLPNFDVYVDEILDMDEWEEIGYHYTNLGKFKKYRNKTTGVQRRSRVNLLSKDKRQSLLANVV